ncbi:NHLP leader peptide family RiPP precursor [Ruegeria sp. 2205SS24-7]|uniref:NHLP leader peptide family RiPP precursor n=1 Tax=Ruegeria discodermiae TaxID=3064389 RepID=UPI0027429249|nr:NHLP leader peptide family RiPP precursor [Ruegeria sp. 2205SS24-7]MDP5216427.1 NHLP leader peptide family RiPP precursor [Ruegeria sp. 2205SS24-7]
MTIKDKQSGADHLTAIYERAWTDEAFNARLKTDPKAAIEEIIGELPADIEINVVQDTADTKYLHIPAAPKQGEVSDSELLGVQGGTTPGCITALTLTISAISWVEA